MEPGAFKYCYVQEVYGFGGVLHCELDVRHATVQVAQ